MARVLLAGNLRRCIISQIRMSSDQVNWQVWDIFLMLAFLALNFDQTIEIGQTKVLIPLYETNYLLQTARLCSHICKPVTLGYH